MDEAERHQIAAVVYGDAFDGPLDDDRAAARIDKLGRGVGGGGLPLGGGFAPEASAKGKRQQRQRGDQPQGKPDWAIAPPRVDRILCYCSPRMFSVPYTGCDLMDLIMIVKSRFYSCNI